MIQLIKQCQKTQNIRTIDLYLRKTINEEIAIKYLPQLSIRTQYQLLRKGSKQLQNLIILEQTTGTNRVIEQFKQNATFGSVLRFIAEKIISTGISPKQPIYREGLLEYLPLHSKLKLFNQTKHDYFNKQIKIELLDYWENNRPLRCRISILLKWLYLQDKKDYQTYLPLVVNEILHLQQGKMSIKAHKYMSLNLEQMQFSELSNVKLFLELYRSIATNFIRKKNNTKRIILIKQRLIERLQLQEEIHNLEEDSKKYNNLSKQNNIEFYSEYMNNLQWLLDEIQQKGIQNHSNKLQILQLVNKLMKNCAYDQQLLLTQVLDAFEPQDMYYPQLKAVFEFLSIIQEFPEAILVQLYRIFADRHILFTPTEFSNILLLISKFQTIEMSDDNGLYQKSILLEVREYYQQHIVQFNTDIHKLMML